MERNIFQQLQAIEQQLLTKKATQVHTHISFSPGSAGQTFHTDGTSFGWIDNKEKEVTEQEAKRRCKPEKNLVQGVAHFNEAECEFKITGKYHSTVAWAYDALIQIAKDSHKPRLVSLELNKGFSGSIIIAKNTIEVAYRTPGSAQQRSIINVINRENLIQAVDLLLSWADPD